MNDLTFSALPAQAPAQSEVRSVLDRQPVLLHYLNIIKRRKWLLVGCVVIAAAIGLVATLLMTPQYTAEATLEIKRENFQIVNVQGVEPEEGSVDLEFYETQWGLLKSQALAERVATQLRLYNDPKFFEMFGENETAEELRDGGSTTAAQRPLRIRRAGELLLDHVKVVPTRMSRLAEVRFTSPDAAMSTEVANAWTQAFIEISLERRFDATSYARKFLEERLGQLRQRLQDSERALVSYASNQRIINVPSSSTTGTDAPTTTERPLVAEDLTTLNRELNEAVAQRVAAESRLRGSGGNTAEGLGNQTIAQLRTRRAELAADHARMMAQFEPTYPPALALTDQIAELDRSIRAEESRVTNTIQATFQAASAREAMLRQRVKGLETDLLDLRGRTIQYNIFQREVDTNRQLYDALLQRYKEIGIAGGVGVNNISIVDRAQVPETPSSPNIALNLLLSLVIGAISGVLLALALEQVDQTISDPRELENALGLPLLGTIPKSQLDNPVEELADPKTGLVEAYLSAQARLVFTTDHGIPRTLAVTSTRPGEGKTTTAYALARQLARSAGNKVVLVDGDMRSPSLHHQFDVRSEPGLSNYLAGADDIGSMLHEVESGLSLLPAGPTPPNAAELLTGDRLSVLLAALVERFDHVVIDAPPVMGLADTPLIASVAEGTIFVVESHATSATTAGVAVSRLRESSARLLGALLTKFEAQKAQYGYGYGYDYGYGYGKSSGAANSKRA